MSTLDNVKIGVIITVWKRQHLEKQLIQLSNQTIKPDYIVVFQNENHINVVDIVKKYNVIHVKSDYNTKFFGRFSYFFNLPVDICIAMDDDIIPGTNCIKNYVEQCVKHNAIITKRGAGRSKSKYREDFNIFAKETCPDCKGEISRFEINGRRAFVCENCQPSPF